MKLAIATDDFKTVTGHVGRCNGFLVVEVENGEIKNVEERENIFTHHKTHEHNNEHNHNHGHNHNNLIEALSDCSHLICTAAGWRLQDELKANGKELVFTNEVDAKQAAIKLENGTLEINEDGSCHAH